MTKDDVEKTKKKVEALYRNYGIEVDGMVDEELARVYNHYLENPEELKSDLNKSKKHACSVSDEDAL
jgi:hypothetical protein